MANSFQDRMGWIVFSAFWIKILDTCKESIYPYKCIVKGAHEQRHPISQNRRMKS